MKEDCWILLMTASDQHRFGHPVDMGMVDQTFQKSIVVIYGGREGSPAYRLPQPPPPRETARRLNKIVSKMLTNADLTGPTDPICLIY